MKQNMPKINLDLIADFVSATDLDLIRRIVNTRTGELRASKPTVAQMQEYPETDPASIFRTYYDFANEDDAKTGLAAYIWRHVAFSISPKPAHQCMPCLDFCDLPNSYKHNMSDPNTKHLHDLVDIVVKSVPCSEWHGVQRWGNAFGLIGTPRYNAEGAVIYR